MKEKLEETRPEWRSFADEQGGESRARTGMPTSITSFDMGLSTVIGSSNRDASGSSLSGAMKHTMDRVRVWDKRSQAANSFDRNLRQAFNEMKMFAEKLAVRDEVIERAAYIYRKAVERGVTRGRSIIQISAAALYAACRDMEVPRTLKDVAAVSNVSKKDLARSYRILLREMDLQMPVPDPIKSVSRIASRATVGEKTKRRAHGNPHKGPPEGDSRWEGPDGAGGSCPLRGIHPRRQREDAEGHRRRRVDHRGHPPKQVQGPPASAGHLSGR